tara:strand:- start:141 stop:338 length:198 start_codon:yes stop_codon:yes gene_type:complete
MKKRKKFTMKGFRSSPLRVEDYDNMTESDKKRLAEKLRNEDQENISRRKSLAVHDASEDDAGSAY